MNGKTVPGFYFCVHDRAKDREIFYAKFTSFEEDL